MLFAGCLSVGGLDGWSTVQFSGDQLIDTHQITSLQWRPPANYTLASCTQQTLNLPAGLSDLTRSLAHSLTHSLTAVRKIIDWWLCFLHCAYVGEAVSTA